MANAKHRYEDTVEPQSSIVVDLGVTRRSVDRLAQQQGWKLRKDRRRAHCRRR
ncbi:hypothetical protein [Rhodopseudomonas palustris]|uniref:hypothetical protein n=1 Tax=Rhodopseudomonas palustris TaxID=1076 RepID=UPI0012ED1114|nr:hypothetical protein [Rhodopseudomonas palustris]